MFFILQTPKRKYRHIDDNFATGCIWHSNNFKCTQWRRFRQNDISRFNEWFYTLVTKLSFTARGATPNEKPDVFWYQLCRHWWHQRLSCYDNLRGHQWRQKKLAWWQLSVSSAIDLWPPSPHSCFRTPWRVTCDEFWCPRNCRSGRFHEYYIAYTK